MRAKLTDQDIISAVDGALAENGINDLLARKETGDNYYSLAPRGDEEPGYSTYTSAEVADVTNSYMPSLARVFLGAGCPIEFVPVNDYDDADAMEAMEKTQFTDAVIKSVPEYYRVMHGALMGACLHPMSVIRYGFDESKTKKIKVHKGIDNATFAALYDGYQNDWDEVNIKEMEQEENESLLDVEFEVVRHDDPKPFIKRVQLDNFVLSRDANGKHDCRIIGELVTARRGELVAAGYSIPLVEQISTSGNIEDNRETQNLGTEWASEIVSGFDGYIRIDANGDGIIELRRVLKFGNVLLENEEIEDDPRAVEFAMGSAILLPDNIAGISPADQTAPYQDAMTSLMRATLDNTAQITRGRLLINTSGEAGLNLHDLTSDGSLVRANPMMGVSIAESVVPLPIQPVATEALTVIQYLDTAKAKSTGEMMANQGLKADALHKETATRFNGLQDSSQAKIELVARNLAETLVRDLYEGMCFYSQMYGVNPKQVMASGTQRPATPANWLRDHKTRAMVGTGYGDNDKTIETFGALLNISTSLAGSTSLFDEKKVYNIIARMIKAQGLHNVSEYVNDPEQPAQLLMAQNQQLMPQMQQMQAQIEANNPLIQIETIRAQAKLESQAMASEIDAMRLELDHYKAISANALKLTELEQNAGAQLDRQLTQNYGSVR